MKPLMDNNAKNAEVPKLTEAGIIGKGIVIKGELYGDEYMIIAGTVEGDIFLKKHLVIESSGVVNAEIQTENITVKGQIRGNLIASEKVEVFNGAKVVGDIHAKKLFIEEGAEIQGNIEMDVPIPDGI
jgi:cytoskeletal protein CcmA (bactofilin family)